MIVDDGSRAKKVQSLLTRAARDKLTTVDLPFDHPEIVVKKKMARQGRSSAYVYKANEDDDEPVILFMPDLGIWLDEHGLNRGVAFHDIYGHPEKGFNFGTELRCKNSRAPGSVGGWSKEPTHVRFYFVDKKMAMLFKLTWGGA